MSYSILMYVCSLKKNFYDLDELFKFTNKIFDIIAVSETRITKQTSLAIKTNLKNRTIQTLSAEFQSEWDCCWDYLVEGYEVSGNFFSVVTCSFPFYHMFYSPYFCVLCLSLNIYTIYNILYIYWIYCIYCIYTIYNIYKSRNQ